MRRTARMVALGTAVGLLLGLASAAHAGQYIGYKGRTEQGERAWAVVRRTDAHRLRLAGFQSGYELTCEDATTQEWIVGVFFFPGWRLDDHRRVHIHANFGSEAVRFNGRLGWSGGLGHTKWVTAQLDENDQAQVCTSDYQGWSLARYTSVPALAQTGKDVALRIGYARVDVDRAGRARLVAYRPPIA